ncbi:hypothetical protein FSP39_005628, partial [Pinctada imbricata]
SLQTVWNRGILTLTGFPGDGKTQIVENLIVTLLKRPPTEFPEGKNAEGKNYWNHCLIKDKPDYNVVMVTSPNDWVMKVKPEKNQLIVLEDMLGSATFTPSILESWIPYLDEIFHYGMIHRPNSLVIVTLHRHQMDKMHPRFKHHPLFHTKNVVDLSREPYDYGGYDKMRILEKICEHVQTSKRGLDMEYGEQEHVRKTETRSFGYSCRLYALVRSFSVQGQAFFRNPDRSFETVLQKVLSFDKVMHYTLACVILFDGKLKLDKSSFEDYDEDAQNIFRQVRIALDVPEDVSLAKMRYICTMLNGVFIKPIQLHQWEIIHERTFYQLCDGIMKTLSKKVIELCSLDFVVQRLRTSTFYAEYMESFAPVYQKDYKELAQRLTFEFLRGNVRLISSHQAFADIRFAEVWAKFISDMGTFSPVVDMKGDYNRSIFFWLAYYGSEAAIRYLLKQEEDMEDIKDEEWFKEELNLALFAACAGHSMHSGKLVKLLLMNGAEIEMAKENLPEADMVLLYGAEVYELAVKQRASLLHIASLYGTYESVEALLIAGLDKDEPTNDGYTPSHRAAMNRYDGAGAIKALTKHKADLTVLNKRNETALHEAVRCGNDLALRHLERSGCKITNESKMGDGRSLLAVAAGQESEQCVRIILEATEKQPKPKGTQDCWKALHEACALGNKKIVKLLLDRGSEVNEKGNNGWTPIQFASIFDLDEIGRMLLEKKVEGDVNAITSSKRSALHTAAENGYYEMCDVLLTFGAKPEALNNQMEYPMNLAATNGHLELVKMFAVEGMEQDYPRESYREREYMMRMMMGGRRMREMFDYD